MEKMIVSYLGASLFEDLEDNNGVMISPELSDEVVNAPVVEEMRGLVRRAKNVDWIAKIIKNDLEGPQTLAISIVRHKCNIPSIKASLFDLWENRNKLSIRVVISLIYSLLNYSDLEEKYHMEMFEYLKKNKEVWKDKVIEWWRNSELVVENARNRLDDPTFPDSKKWIYLAQIAWFGKEQDSLKLLQNYVNPCQHVKTVVQSLIDDLKKDHRNERILISRDSESGTEIAKYILRKLSEDIENGCTLNPKVYYALSSFEPANSLRSFIKTDDVGWLTKLLKSQKPEERIFALSVVRPLQEDPDIRMILFQMWGEPALPNLVKQGLIFRLLDYKDLDLSIQEGIWHWVSANREIFMKRVRERYRSDNKLVEHALGRLNDPNFAESKKWIYLAQIAWSNDGAKHIDILTGSAQSGGTFMAQVAKELLKAMENAS
jgi:hypothetical protein